MYILLIGARYRPSTKHDVKTKAYWVGLSETDRAPRLNLQVTDQQTGYVTTAVAVVEHRDEPTY
jgi:hypothetical protein